MAYNDSGELPVSQSTYSLGGYTFELKVQNVHEPGEPDVVSVFAICRGPDGTRETQAMDFPEGTTVESWSVECNETEATVYANTKSPEGPDVPAPFYKPVPSSSGQAIGYYEADSNRVLVGLGSNAVGTATWTDNLDDGMFTLLLAQTDNPQPFADFLVADEHYAYVNSGRAYTFNGKTAYYTTSLNSMYSGIAPPVGYAVDQGGFGNAAVGPIAWQMLYGAGAGKTEDVLVARFAIDIREADGGPDDDWDEPGDVGPKNKKLIITVIGANTGTHDQTVFPSDNETVKWYGFGGDGGYGGGGGAGTSTVIIYDYATDLADEVEEDAIIRYPHGVGSGGGKGGKGGDGCILIFY